MSIYKNGEKYNAVVRTNGEPPDPVDWNDIQNKPDFQPVATSGDYDDLNNKPEIPSIEGLASEQWVEDQGYLTEHQDISGKVDRSELAPVATSGSYNDLGDKPIIEPVYDSTITINQGGEKRGEFTLNQEGDVTIDLEAGGGSDTLILYGVYGADPALNKPAVDEIVRILSSGELMPPVYVNEHGVYHGAIRIDLSSEDIGVTTLKGEWEGREIFKFDGTYIGVQNTRLAGIWDIHDSKVTIKQGEKEQSFTLNQEGDVTIDLEAGGSTDWDDIQDKPEFKTVATSGDYNDLNNKPEIPSIEGLASETYVHNYVDEQIGNINSILENI